MIVMLSRSLTILILSIFCLQSSGQIVTVNSEFSSDSTMIGSQLFFTLTAESGPEVFLSLPVFSDTITKEIEILTSSDIDTSYEDGRRIISQKYKVASFEPGWNIVPPQAIIFEVDELRDTIYKLHFY